MVKQQEILQMEEEPEHHSDLVQTHYMEEIHLVH